MTGATYSVVVADDVAGLRRLLRLALEGSGRFRVEAEVETGAQAVEAARAVRPDLVLLDLSMPEMDGLEALPLVLEASPSSRVVVLSGFNHARMGPIALRMGASVYLEKGIDPDALLDALLGVVEPVARAPGQGPGAPAAPVAEPPAPASGLGEAAGRTLRVLVIESDEDTARRVLGTLEAAAGTRFLVARASALHEGLNALAAGGIDVVLVDTQLPDSEGADTVVETLGHAGHVPVVVLSRAHDRAVQTTALKLGAEDLVTPADLAGPALARSLLYAVERRFAQEARRTVHGQAIMIDRLRELEHMKSQFLNSAAHELNTPLTPLKLQLHLLRRAIEAGDAGGPARSLDVLDRNVDRLAKLVGDLLEVARLQSGRLDLRKERLRLRPVLEDVVESFGGVAAQRRIALEARLDEDARIEADPRRLHEVFVNVVSNALKFTPPGGRVRVETRVRSDDVLVSVRDTGPGLTQAQIGHLFQPFSRVLDGEAAGAPGTGLGLFVARGIVLLHGGRIWCESDGPGTGCTFHVALPHGARESPGPGAATAVALVLARVPAVRRG